MCIISLLHRFLIYKMEIISLTSLFFDVSTKTMMKYRMWKKVSCTEHFFWGSGGVVMGTKPRTLRMLGKYSTHWGTLQLWHSLYFKISFSFLLYPFPVCTQILYFKRTSYGLFHFVNEETKVQRTPGIWHKSSCYWLLY